jgi:PKD repeat protein
MKLKFTTSFTLLFFSCVHLIAQTYISSNYAAAGDTAFLTKATISNLNLDTTGIGITWDYASLNGNSQTIQTFKSPNQTGYSAIQFPFIYNANNTNLAQTDNQTIYIGSIQATSPIDYFKKTNAVLQQSASAYRIVIGATSFAIKNTFTSPDVIYRFPIAINNIDSSNSAYTTNIPGIYYRNTQIKRVNRVNGTGTVITPYGTFTNALRVVSEVTQTDSIAIDTIILPQTILKYREIKFLDASKKYPVLIVKQNLIGNIYVTSSIEYLDNRQYFQPTAAFGYAPVCPIINDTIQFQNLSQNATTYLWNFDDINSGINNTSTLNNPFYIYSTAGNYNVKLITYNGSLSDTIIIPVFINQNLDTPTITISTTSNTVCSGTSVTFNSSITNGGNSPIYRWKKNGVNIPNANASSFTTNNLTNNDTITCQLNSSIACVTSASVISNSIYLNILSIPNAPNSIIGPTTICEFSSNEYSIEPISGASSYSWILPNGFSGQSSSNSILISFNQIGGLLQVAANNTCGTSATQSLNISVNNIDNAVILNGAELISNLTAETYQWINCGEGNIPIEGEINQNYFLTSSGSYAVVISQNGCLDTTECYNAIITDFKLINENNSIKVYPNPANTTIHLNCNKGFQIYNCTGSLIMKSTQPTNTIFIGELPQGFYFLKTNDKVGRFIKE